MKPTPKNLRFAILAADTVLFTYLDGEVYVRLIPVDLPPHYKNAMGLPGGLLQPTEMAEEAARRHLENKAKISGKNVYAEQLYTFSEIDRDPRGRVVAVAYLALVPWESLDEKERVIGNGTGWYPVTKLPKLAYDHKNIIAVALERFRSKVSYSSLIAKIMPKEFTLTELERAYTTILKKSMDKRNFRKKILRVELVKELKKKVSHGRQRPASLFRFVSDRIRILEMV
jgi:8-oxo-dGTP diphosphatase